MAAVEGFISITYVDYDNESSNVRMRCPAKTAANFDAENLEMVTLLDAIAGITEGVRVKVQYGNDQRIAFGPAEDETAQRELKWLVQYHDATTLKRYTLELPCADRVALDEFDRPNAAIGDEGVVDAFVAAFEQFALTPDGNAPHVDEITLVGRSI